MKLTDIDPATLADAAHDLIERRARTLAFATGHDLAPGGLGASDVRHAVRQLAHYARTGTPPEGRRELVHEYYVSLVGVDLIPGDLDPPDEPAAGVDETEAAVHLVVLACLARDRLHANEAVPAAWLAVLAGVAPSRVRQLVSSGELRRWKRVSLDEKRLLVHPDDARRWLAGRVV